MECNFKWFNGLTYKCNLKHTSLDSDDEHNTCDESNCILMKIARVFNIE